MRAVLAASASLVLGLVCARFGLALGALLLSGLSLAILAGGLVLGRPS